MGRFCVLFDRDRFDIMELAQQKILEYFGDHVVLLASWHPEALDKDEQWIVYIGEHYGYGETLELACLDVIKNHYRSGNRYAREE